MHVVWFKRDLRLEDHAPLAAAARAGAVLPLYVVEPEWLAAPDSAGQHLGFVRECLASIKSALRARGSDLVILSGAFPDVLARLNDRRRITALYSHEETGNALTYARDRRVAAWCREHGVPWHEFPRDGVVRRLRTRDRWSAHWGERMSGALIEPPRQLAPVDLDLTGLQRAPDATALAALHARAPDKPQRQRGGRHEALALLASFFAGRGDDYRRAMSSPLTAPTACSRLSPHFAYGTLSIREVAQHVWRRRAELHALPPAVRPIGALAALKSFEARLHWRCHFIQKLESEPELEFRAVHAAFDDLRAGRCDPATFTAWCRGETGYPLVDACLRYLAATGWLNFRMRAMVTSFSSHTLWNHWREPALHLAREFLDYEPGIHYPQIQMQSGVTGINAVRIYNPVKQAQDQDPQGVFVRRWLPALARVPLPYVFAPWTMPAEVQQVAGCVIGRDYPAPIVDHVAASRLAAERIHALRRRDDVRREAQAVYVKHGSRHPDREGRRSKRSITQNATLPLF